MKKEDAWNAFVKTGNVEAYLLYAGAVKNGAEAAGSSKPDGRRRPAPEESAWS